jgi:hypothetical protein
MKVLTHLFFLFLCPILSLPLSAQPRLEIAGGNKFDLGRINRGSVVERKVELKNIGNETLVLEKVEASCGCTGTVVSKDQIPAGQTGTVLITFNSKNFSGPVHKSVTVRTNIPDAPPAVIEFTATVFDEIVLNPQQFWFKDAEVGRTASLTITVRNDGEDNLTLSGFRTTLQGFSMKLPQGAIKPGQEAKIVGEYAPKNESPVISEGVFVKTSNPRQPEIFVPIYGNAKVFKFE